MFASALVLTAFLHEQYSKIGPLLAVAGGVVIAAWPILSNPYGHGAIILAFMINFLAEARTR